MGSISRNDRTDLIRRLGAVPNAEQIVDSAIADGIVWDVSRGVMPANSALPGTWLRTGYAGPEGMAIAMRSYVQGAWLTLGVQVKTDDPDGKYKWLSSADKPASIPQFGGEMPVPVFPTGDAAADFITLSEGALKPWLALNRQPLHQIPLGAAIVGYGGSNWASAFGQLLAQCEHFGVREIRVLLDAGAVENPHVWGQVRRLQDRCLDAGIRLQMVWWGQQSKPAKGADKGNLPAENCDIDELNGPVDWQLLSVAELERLAGIEPEEKCDRTTTTDGPVVPQWSGSDGLADMWPEVQAAEQQRQAEAMAKTVARINRLAETQAKPWRALAEEEGWELPDDPTQVESHVQSLMLQSLTAQAPYDLVIANRPNEPDLENIAIAAEYDGPVVLTGATGGGKSYTAREIVQYLQQQGEGLNLWWGTPTQNLSLQAANQLRSAGFDCSSTVEACAYATTHHTAPVESLYKSHDYPVTALVLDEPDNWLPRFLEGKLGEQADANLNTLRSFAAGLIQQYWLNADISDITLDFIEFISGQRPLVVDIQNDQPAGSPTVTLYRDGPGGLSGDAALYNDAITGAAQGKKTFMETGCVAKGRAVHKRFTRINNHRKRVNRAREKQGLAPIPLLRVVRFDGEYTPQAQRQRFAADPDSAIAGADVVIVTRLVETGLDLQAQFDRVVCVASPKMTASATYQLFSRCRSLLRGETPELLIYLPERTFVSPEQMGVQYWQDRIRSESVAWLRLSADPGAEQAIQEMAPYIEFLARYRADEARRTYYRNALLIKKFNDLGWTIAGEIVASHEDRASAAAGEQIKRDIAEAEMTWARAIARGHRYLSEYGQIDSALPAVVAAAQAFVGKLGDSREQGLIVRAKRRKIELATALPDSPLDDPIFVARLEADPIHEARAVLAAALDMRGDLDAYHQALQANSRETTRLNGTLEGIKRIQRKADLLAIEIASILAQCPVFDRMRRGDDELHKYQDDVIQAYEVLKSHADTLNLWCRRYVGRVYVWDEKDVLGCVLKASRAFFGCKTVNTGYPRLSGGLRAKTYRTTFSHEGRFTIASAAAEAALAMAPRNTNIDTQAMIDSAIRQLDSEQVFRAELARSAQTGLRIKQGQSLIGQNRQTVLPAWITDSGELNEKLTIPGISFSSPAGETVTPVTPIPSEEKTDQAPLMGAIAVGNAQISPPIVGQNGG